jgi:hypothetical protein
LLKYLIGERKMALVNRDKDVSEQKEVLQAHLGAVVTGASIMSVMIPYPAILDAIDVAAQGVSGLPTWQFNILRFAGGLTAIAVGVSTLAVQTLGTSGVQQVAGFSAVGVLPALAPQSSTLAVLQAGDVISIVSGGANSAVGESVVAVVIKKTQDVLSQFGING